MFVPRWQEIGDSAVGTPHSALPVVSALVRNGYTVDLYLEPLDSSFSDGDRRHDDDLCAAVAWFATANSEAALPGACRFLSAVAAAAPETPRLIGGGFVPAAGRTFDFEGLATPVRDDAPDALLVELEALANRPAPGRQPFLVDAFFESDLTELLHISPAIFRNSESVLWLPTGSGSSTTTDTRRSNPPLSGSAPASPSSPGPTDRQVLPADGIVELMVFSYHRYGTRQFQLGEPAFLADRPRAVELAERLAAEGLPLRWSATASIPEVLAMSEAELTQLHRAGLTALEMDTSAGNDSALSKLGKGFRVVHTLRAHDRLVTAGIMPVHDFVFGWPGESERDRRATLGLVDRLHRTSPQRLLRFRLFVPALATPEARTAFGMPGPRPRSLTELGASSRSADRTLPWLPASAEKRSRLLTEYLLPLAYGEAPEPGTEGALTRRALATLARARCRTGWLSFPLDRALFGSSVTASGAAPPA